MKDNRKRREKQNKREIERAEVRKKKKKNLDKVHAAPVKLVFYKQTKLRADREIRKKKTIRWSDKKGTQEGRKQEKKKNEKKKSWIQCTTS